jgi:hypothetical protein
VPRVSVAVAVAGRFPLSALWVPGKFAGEEGPAAVWLLSTSDFGDGGNDLSGHPHSSARVVPSHVVGDHPEERSQRKTTTCRGLVSQPDTHLIPLLVVGYLNHLVGPMPSPSMDFALL